MTVALVVGAVALAVSWFMLYQLVVHYGRVIRRLDELEAAIRDVRTSARLAMTDGRNGLVDNASGGRKRLRTERSLGESRINRTGLTPGTQAPRFRLPSPYGSTVALDDFTGRRLLVVLSDPRCEPCDRLAPELGRLSSAVSEDAAIVMISRGAPEENRRTAELHGFAFPIGLQRAWEVSKQFGVFETPAAFLVDETGLIAHGVATGRDEILALAHSVLVKENEYERTFG